MPYLTDTKIRHAKSKDKDYKLYDEQDIFLLICATGSKLWRFRYRFDGKEKLLALRSYPARSVAEAREERNNILLTLNKGKDPAVERKNTLKGRRLFRDTAESYYEEHKNIWSDQHRKDVRGRINNYILPTFGDHYPDEILPIEIFELLKKIQGPRRDEGKHYDLAKKVKGIISQVFCKSVTERGYM